MHATVPPSGPVQGAQPGVPSGAMETDEGPRVIRRGDGDVIDEGVEATATVGDVVVKPRGRWHTFWNAGDDELRVLEIIVPGGLEQMFRLLAEPGGEYSPETLPALAAEYGAEVDFEATMPLVERHGLVF